MLSEYDVDATHDANEAVVEHCAGTVGGLLCGLKYCDNRARPFLTTARQHVDRAKEAYDVDVVTARMHHRHAVISHRLACVGQSGVIAHRQRVHVRTQ